MFNQRLKISTKKTSKEIIVISKNEKYFKWSIIYCWIKIISTRIYWEDKRKILKK